MPKTLYCISNKTREGEFIVAEIGDPLLGPAWTERVLRKLDADGYRIPLRIEFARKLVAGAAVPPAVARVLYRADTGTTSSEPASLTVGYTTLHMSADDIRDIFRLVVPGD